MYLIVSFHTIFSLYYNGDKRVLLLPTGKQCGDPEYSCPKDIILLIKIVILSSAVDASFNSVNMYY